LEDDSSSETAETEIVESFDLVVVVDDRDVPVDVPKDDSAAMAEAPPESPDEAVEAPGALVSVAAAAMGGNSKRSTETAAIACFRSCTVTVEPLREWVR
jgi:hypothetical protein